MRNDENRTYEDFIAQRVFDLRTYKGVTGRVMSTALGQNPTYISQIENKKSLPSVQGLFAICEYFGMTPQGFFDESGDLTGNAAEIVHELSTLDDTELYLIKELVKKFQQNKANK